VQAAGNNLTIKALGDQTVTNHAYSGPSATTAPFNEKSISRHYGFGSRPAGCPASGPCPNVTIGGKPMTDVTWSDLSITGKVPAGVAACSVQQAGQSAAQCGELSIVAANGKKSIDTVTVTIGGKAPTFVNGENGSNNAIQTAIDKASPGDMILVGPGTYNEMLLMWKPVRLQGVGAPSVVVNANTHPSGKLDPWRRQVQCLFGVATNGGLISATNPYDKSGTYTCPANMQRQVDAIPLEPVIGWDGTLNGNLGELLIEPTLMGAYEGAAITVLAKGYVTCP
jgi:hypothetical protein